MTEVLCKWGSDLTTEYGFLHRPLLAENDRAACACIRVTNTLVLVHRVYADGSNDTTCQPA